MTRHAVFALSTSSPARALEPLRAPLRPSAGPQLAIRACHPDAPLVALAERLRAYDGRRPTDAYNSRRAMRALVRDIAVARAWGLAGLQAKAETLAFVLKEDRFIGLSEELATLGIDLFSATSLENGRSRLDRDGSDIRATKANTRISRAAAVAKGHHDRVDRDAELSAIAAELSDLKRRMREVRAGEPLEALTRMTDTALDCIERIRAIPAFGEAGLRAKMTALSWVRECHGNFESCFDSVPWWWGGIAVQIFNWLASSDVAALVDEHDWQVDAPAGGDAVLASWGAELRRLVAVDAELPRNALRPEMEIESVRRALLRTRAEGMLGFCAKATVLRSLNYPHRDAILALRHHFSPVGGDLALQILDRMTDDDVLM